MGGDLRVVDLGGTDARAGISETRAGPRGDDAEKCVGGFYDRVAELVRETAAGAGVET